MPKLRLLSALALTVAVLLPSGTVTAQDETSGASPVPGTTTTADDSRLVQLEQLMPSTLAGLSLDDNLQLATGEELISVMQPQESDLVLALLDEHGKTPADYAAAATWLPFADEDIVVVQAHRIAGIDAASTTEAWLAILSLGLEQPASSEGRIGGRPVRLLADEVMPDMPLLHLFPADDVMWMVVAADEAIVEEAMAAIAAEGGEEVEEAEEAEATEATAAPQAPQATEAPEATAPSD